MAKPRVKKKREPGRRQIATSLPKRQYKRTNRLLYILSGVLLVVFGGGAALVSQGAPPPSTPTPVPAVSQPAQGTDTQAPQFTTPAPSASPTATP